MTGKPASTGWITTVLVLLLPLLGLGVWEALQRHRFSVQAEQLDAALRTFQSGAAMIGDNGKPLPTAGGRTSYPFIALNTSDVDAGSFRCRLWTMGAAFVDSQGCWRPFRVDVEIEQQRTVLLLGSPEIMLLWNYTPDAALEAALSDTLKHVTYRVGIRGP